MLGCDKTITLTHTEYNSHTGTDIVTETEIYGVSWYSQNRAAVDSAGLHAARTFKCRIPEEVLPDGVMPMPGDTIYCCGTSATVLDVHDNRGHALGHVYVEAG